MKNKERLTKAKIEAADFESLVMLQCGGDEELYQRVLFLCYLWEVRMRKGFELWLLAQALTVAIAEETELALAKARRECKMVETATGVNGQDKLAVNPILPHLDKALRTQTQALCAFGLNYDTTPSKVKEDTSKGVDPSDNMREFYEQAK